MSTLSVVELSVSYGDNTVVRNVSLDLSPGKIVGLIGPNGAGKTSLLDALSGIVPVSAGKILLDGVDLVNLRPHERARRGLARTFQTLELFEELTIAENLRASGAPRDTGLLRSVTADKPASRLPHHARRMASIDRALARDPQVLLLDEPGAGLDAVFRDELVHRLRTIAANNIAILLVDHDTSLVLDIADEVVVIDAGQVIFRGMPAGVLDDDTVRSAYFGNSLHATDRRRSAAKDVGRRSTISVEGITSGYGDVSVVRDVSLTVSPGEIVALLGPNGGGKTTLLLTIAGILSPTRGKIEITGGSSRDTSAERARLGVATVRRGQSLFARLSVIENLRMAAGRRSRERIDTVLEQFPSLRVLRRRTAGLLSGGEQQQLAVASALVRRPRLLLLDDVSFGVAPTILSTLSSALHHAADNYGTAILLSDSHFRFGLTVADRAYVLHQGVIVLSGTAKDLASRVREIEENYLRYHAPLEADR